MYSRMRPAPLTTSAAPPAPERSRWPPRTAARAPSGRCCSWPTPYARRQAPARPGAAGGQIAGDLSVDLVCADQFRPLNMQPRKGKAWRPARPPPAARDLHPPRRRDAHARRARPGHRQAVYRIRARSAASSSSTCSKRSARYRPTRSCRWSATTSARTGTPPSVTGKPYAVVVDRAAHSIRHRQ